VKRLIWTRAARADLEAIAEYYAGIEPHVGELLIDRIEQAAAKLARYDTGRPGRIAGTREKSVAPARYVIVYETHGEMIFIFRVVHMARDWP